LRLTDENHTVAGFVKDSFLHTPRDSTQRPGGSGVEGFAYERGEALSRLPEQGALHKLSHGGIGIACHRDWEILRGELMSKAVEIPSSAQVL
jgi:hypothetical protein